MFDAPNVRFVRYARIVRFVRNVLPPCRGAGYAHLRMGLRGQGFLLRQGFYFQGFFDRLAA